MEIAEWFLVEREIAGSDVGIQSDDSKLRSGFGMYDTNLGIRRGVGNSGETGLLVSDDLNLIQNHVVRSGLGPDNAIQEIVRRVLEGTREVDLTAAGVYFRRNVLASVVYIGDVR